MPEEILYIQKNEPLSQAEDYPFLRETGLQYLQALSGKIWTDYNIHDPGITMLELLCYAITDIGYRARFPMADLLTREGASAPDKTNSFFTAKEILTTHPVTVEDYRRLLIDKIPGLKNVWLEEMDNADMIPADGKDTTYFQPRTKGYFVNLDDENHQLKFANDVPGAADMPLHIHGVYRVKIELEDWETMLADTNVKARIQKALNTVRTPGSPLVVLKRTGLVNTRLLYEQLVKRTLHRFRNLCEDFETVAIMKDEQVTVCADIEVTPETDINELIKKIYRIIYNYASPSLNFYSLQEMLDKGKAIEEIFEGTVPLRGFVDYEELKTRFNRQRTVMYTSDLINMIMDLQGVVAVKKLLLTSADDSGNIIKDGEKYCLHLSDTINRSFRFKRVAGDGKAANRINFFKANLPFKAKEPEAGFVMRESKEPALFISDLPVPGGTNRGLNQYHLVQNEFPNVYYTGLDKMPQAEATKLRQNQRMQLKGYLVFFEQLLANFLAQLNNLSSLYSWNNPENINTYSFQKLNQLTAVDEVLINFSGLEDISSEYLKILNNPETNVARRNRLLDSLLARFNEKFVDYSVFKYTHNSESLSVNTQRELVKDKCSFLKKYAVVSANRSHAFDIYRNARLTHHLYNLSGFHQYLTVTLGLNVYEDHYLAKVLRDPVTDEVILDAAGKPTYFDIRGLPFDKGFGLHIMEHILLRPLGVDKANPENLQFLSLCCCDDGKEPTANDYCSDPYSMRITVVLPGWLNLSLDMEFRKFVNTTIRSNAPAHIAVKICWIGMEQMYEYEKTYVAFLKWLQIRESINFNAGSTNDIVGYNKALSDFVHVINNLKNVYPPASLHDCENSEKDVDGNFVNRTVILNRTTLGDTSPTGLNIIPYKKPYPYPVPNAPILAVKIADVKPRSYKIPGKNKKAEKKVNPVPEKKPVGKNTIHAKRTASKKITDAKKKTTSGNNKSIVKTKDIAKSTILAKSAPAKEKPAPQRKKLITKVKNSPKKTTRAKTKQGQKKIMPPKKKKK
jgi:hypothetical protein